MTGRKEKARRAVETVELAHDFAGEGEAVLCAGGWGLRGAADLAVLLPHVAAGRRLLTFHYRGMGESPDGPDVDHSSRLYAQDLLRLLDREQLPRAHLLGMGGMGAIVLMELAIAAPERVGAAVLHEAWAACDTSLAWQLQALRDARRLAGFEAYQRLAAVLCFTPDYLDEHAGHILANVWVNLREREAAHLRFIDVCLEHDARDRLAGLTAPCLLVTGDSTDLMTGDRFLAELAAGIPRAETHVMRGTPHAFFQSPAAVLEFDRVVAAFLDRHPLAE